MDSEMPSVSEERTVKARVQHTCCECPRTIPVGEKYNRVKGCWDGKWATFDTCAACAALRDELEDPYSGFAPFGDLASWAAEHNVGFPPR